MEPPHKNKLESDKIVLDPAYPDWTVSIGSDMPIEIRPKIVSFLKGKVDNFAWSHLDMTGISPDIITHNLNIGTRVKPVRQKRRKIAPERNKAVEEEINKLLEMKMIREVMYRDWLANVVVVPKKNGK